MNRGFLKCVMTVVLWGALFGSAWALEEPAPPPLPDLVSPADMPATPPSAETLDLPGGLRADELALPELPTDFLSAPTQPTPETAVKEEPREDKKEKKAKKEKEKKEKKGKKDKNAKEEPTPTSVPEPNPTQEPIPTAEVSAAPTPAGQPTVSGLSAVGPVVAEGPLTGLEAFFPMRQGRKWTYSNGTTTRVVECVSREVGPGGVVKASFRNTEGAIVSEELYALKGGQVTLAAATEDLREGWIRLQAVPRGTVPRWAYDRRDGTASYYKAELGSRLVGDKTYAECVTVTERTLKGARQISLKKSIYARGVGLVSVEAIDESGAPLASTSWVLVEPAR